MKFDGFKKSQIDESVEAAIERHCSEFGVTPCDAVKHFPVLIRRHMLKRFLAHVELFKRTIHVPGDIIELGVFRGMGLMTWSNLLEAYCIGNRTKMVYGFDNWTGFTGLSPEDGEALASSHKQPGGFTASLEEIQSAIRIFDSDRFVPWKDRIRLIQGNIEDTVPRFIEENPGVRFSLVHFDCDLFKPTEAALRVIWPRVCKGGVVIFDEYAIKEWPGETFAVNRVLPEVQLRNFDWTNAPAAYAIK